MKLVKAEILWTRICPLNCDYCSMNTGKSNIKSSVFWKDGLINLKKLGCPFIAIYGAEPLSDFDKLPQFITDANELGLEMTLISSCSVPGWQYKLHQLYDCGLRSLTVSYDMCGLNASSRIKTNKALQALEYFKTLGPIKNTAVVVTLTRTNMHLLTKTIQQMTEKNIWTFFDLIHKDRGQPGSKTKGENIELSFRKEDTPVLKKILLEVQQLKNNGALVHASLGFLKELHQNSDLPIKLNWNCAKHTCFPSWVTVNCDGLVYPCDDFQPKGIGVSFDKLAEVFPTLNERWKSTIKCPGCCWNTHIDAHLIKQQKENIKNYVHGGV